MTAFVPNRTMSSFAVMLAHCWIFRRAGTTLAAFKHFGHIQRMDRDDFVRQPAAAMFKKVRAWPKIGHSPTLVHRARSRVFRVSYQSKRARPLFDGQAHVAWTIHSMIQSSIRTSLTPASLRARKGVFEPARLWKQ